MSKALYAREEKQTPKMLIPESVMWLLKITIPPLWVWVWIDNFYNVKSVILFIITMIIGSIMGYLRIIKMSRMNERVRLDNEAQEIENQERRNAAEEKRVELIEKELTVKVTGIPRKK